MRIFVHSCCGPCLIGVAETLRREGHEITAFWYNPNVMPYREYRRRRGAFREVCDRLNIKPEVADEYDLPLILGRVLAPAEKPGRCANCYGLRLNETARRVADGGYDAFATTLMISSRQDCDLVRGAAAAASNKHGVPFLDRDFRDVEESSHAAAREMGVHIQGYCGCIYSEEERYRKK
ncbi:MAG: epoxyqueuosine reductase QueH [Candidatus Coatesbacteria bacterium]|nr:MAG: epoxyqueuosine reductase QueH [Candidatus Coatesbacteria bacterium]